MDCDSASLLLAAKCFGEISTGDKTGVRDYLLCQWANKTACADPDGAAFISFIGLQDPVKQAAVCQLCLDLKNTVPATTPATSFWDREILIYPMVADGPSYPLAQQGVNLKAPGTFTLLQSGAAPIYSNLGIQGVKATSAFLDTQYVIPAGSQDSLRIMWYMDLDSDAVNDSYFGTRNATSTSRTAGICTTGLGRPFNFDINCFVGLQSAAGASPLGAYFIERNPAGGATPVWCAYGPAILWTKQARASVAPSPFSIYLLSTNFNGASNLPSQSRLSGFSLGTPLSDPERLQYKTIWDTFENSLGRGHP